MAARFPDSKTVPCVQCGTPFWQSATKVGRYLKRFCDQACINAYRRDPERQLANFWARVDKAGPNGCWIWNGCRDKWGYGDLQWKGKHIQAHRLAWKLLRDDPGKLDCLHKCNNPPCCNPDHLYLGTDKENAADKLRAGTQPRGETNGSSKLTEAKVREIRALKGQKTQKEIAAIYGIHFCYVQTIWTRRAWAHVK